jgi:hypothetical protein
MALLASLVTRLSLESSSFSTGLSRARRQAQTDTSAIAKSVDGINSKLKAFGTGLSLAALGSVAKRALDYASSLGEVAQQLGVTTKDLQTYRFAASQVGIEQEAMDKGLQKLTQNMGKAEVGSKPLQAAFAAIGISLADLKGKTAGDTIPKIADGLSKIPDPARRAAVEVALFGKAGQQLDTLLAGGSRGINQLAAEAEKLGIVLSNKQIQDADALADKLSALKQVLEARIAGTIADNAQSILTLANSFAQLAVGIAKFWSQDPGKAMGLVGAGIGLKVGGRFGVVGAAVGSAVGFMVGASSAPDTPQSQLHIANLRQAEARRIAASHGYVHGRNSQRDRDILKLPDVQEQLTLARKSIGRAQVAARTGAIATPSSSANVPGIDVPDFLAGGGGGGKKKGGGGTDHTEQLAKEALRVSYEMDKDLIDGKRDILQAQQGVDDDYKRQAKAAEDIAKLDLEGKQRSIKFDLDMILTDKTISDAQKQEAKVRAERANTLADDLYNLDMQKIANDRELETQRNEAALVDKRFDARKEALQAEEGLATTASERRKIELELLDIAYQQRKIALDHIRNDMLPNGNYSHSDAERAQAGVDLSSLNAGYGAAKQGVLNSTRGPIETFLAGIPKTAAEANEALQSIAVGGLQSLSEGLANAIMGAKSLGKVFGNVAKQIIAELIKIQIERSIIGPLANALGSVFGASFGNTKVTGFAGGGYTGDGPANAVAGAVHKREYVFDSAATRRLGVPTLEALSKGRPIMATSPGQGGAGNIIVHQTFAPNLAGNAVDRMELVRWMAIAKQDTMASMRDISRRKPR